MEQLLALSRSSNSDTEARLAAAKGKIEVLVNEYEVEMKRMGDMLDASKDELRK